MIAGRGSGFYEFAKATDRAKFASRRGKDAHKHPSPAVMLQTDLHGTRRVEQTKRVVSLTGITDSEKNVCPWPKVQNGFILFVNTEILLSHLGNSNFTEKESCSC